MSDNTNPWEPRGKEYLIIFGNVDNYVAWANRPPSESLKVTPFLEQLQAKHKTTETDPLKILAETGRPTMLMVMESFKDRAAMDAACNASPESFALGVDLFDLDDEVEGGLGYSVYVLAGELVTAEFDCKQVASGMTLKDHKFPAGWEIDTVAMLTSSGSIKNYTVGRAGAINIRVLNIRIFNWFKERGQDYDTHINTLKHLNMSNVMLINDEILEKEPNAVFTVYSRKSRASKQPVLKSV